ncbi:hypothetical protein GY45DRAFT_884546 [Cubamyces sp. BRFM 1775]|nr:hypothetical protein GY45DRAFT_884546 [Cubamyces sp. BRFM 1775]
MSWHVLTIATMTARRVRTSRCAMRIMPSADLAKQRIRKGFVYPCIRCVLDDKHYDCLICKFLSSSALGFRTCIVRRTTLALCVVLRLHSKSIMMIKTCRSSNTQRHSKPWDMDEFQLQLTLWWSEQRHHALETDLWHLMVVLDPRDADIRNLIETCAERGERALGEVRPWQLSRPLRVSASRPTSDAVQAWLEP